MLFNKYRAKPFGRERNIHTKGRHWLYEVENSNFQCQISVDTENPKKLCFEVNKGCQIDRVAFENMYSPEVYQGSKSRAKIHFL